MNNCKHNANVSDSPVRILSTQKKYFSTILRWGRVLWHLIVLPHNVWCHLDIHINRLEQTHNTFDYSSWSQTLLCQIINMIPCCINHKMKFQIFTLWIGFQTVTKVTTMLWRVNCFGLVFEYCGVTCRRPK